MAVQPTLFRNWGRQKSVITLSDPRKDLASARQRMKRQMRQKLENPEPGCGSRDRVRVAFRSRLKRCRINSLISNEDTSERIEPARPPTIKPGEMVI